MPNRRTTKLDADALGKMASSAEAAFVLAAVREVYKKLPAEHMNKYSDLADLLVRIDPTIMRKCALDLLHTRAVSEDQRAKISIAASNILANNYKYLKSSFANVIKSNNDSDTVVDKSITVAFSYLDKILAYHNITTNDLVRQIPYSDIIFDNWKRPFGRGNEYIIPGVYQMFRRYKPPRRRDIERYKSLYDWTKPSNHAIICEIVLIDADAMECVLVTARRKVYVGTMFINKENMLNVLLQRKSGDGTGTNQRFISHCLDKQDTKLFSAISIKSGDTSRVPVASECLLIRVPREKHQELYEAMSELRMNSQTKLSVTLESIISRYVSDTPPSARFDPDRPDETWKRVRFVRDFPEFAELVKDDEGGALFREPLKALSRDRVARLTQMLEFKVFTQA